MQNIGTTNRHGLAGQRTGVGDPTTKYIKGVETTETFSGLKEITLEALMFQVADLAKIPRTLEVSELLERLLEKGVVTAEEYNEVIRRLEH